MIVSKGSYSQGIRPQEPAFQSLSILKKVKALVAQSCLTLQTHSPPRSSVLGILQARILEWVAIPFSWVVGSLSAPAKGFLRKWEGRGELEDAFPHSDSVLSTFPFLALSPGSAPSPRERTVKLLFQVSSTVRQTTSVLIHYTILWGKTKQDS